MLIFGYFIVLCVALASLVGGANLLVRVGVNLSKDFRLSETFVGITFLSWATSLPEIVVSLGAAIQGSSDIAMGSLLGSNICNALLIIGICALVTPFGVRFNIENLFLPGYVVIGISTIFFTWWFHQSGMWWAISKWQASIFLSLYIIYFALICWRAPRVLTEQEMLQPKSKIPTQNILKYLVYSIVGVLLIWIGGHFSVQTVTELSKVISTQYGYASAEKLVSLTVLALGTSLPELVTSILASFRGKTAMGLSNIMGSNMLNKFGILPICCYISPIIVRDTYLVVYTIISDIIVPVLCLLLWGRKIFTHVLGICLLVMYVIYLLQVTA